MRITFFALLATVLLAFQAEACWYVDDNFVRKECGNMPRELLPIYCTLTKATWDTNTQQIITVAKRDIVIHGFEEKITQEDLKRMLE